jgi:hypothetical protein
MQCLLPVGVIEVTRDDLIISRAMSCWQRKLEREEKIFYLVFILERKEKKNYTRVHSFPLIQQITMSSIIHALTGHGDNSEKRSSVHTVVYEDVKVKSVVSSETQSKVTGGHSNNKINELMAKLGSTHAQIDEYSRRRNDEISEAVQTSIEKIVHETQNQQQQLLNDAQKESNEIDNEYKKKLMS